MFLLNKIKLSGDFLEQKIEKNDQYKQLLQAIKIHYYQ